MPYDRRSSRRGRGRGYGGRSSVFTPGGGPRGVPKFSANASRPSFVGPPSGQATVTPRVEAFAPQGAPAAGFGGGSALVDAIMQEPEPGPVEEFAPPQPEPAPVAPPEDIEPAPVDLPPTDEMPLPAATSEFGTTPYGDPITEPPITQAQVERSGGVVPDSSDPYGVSSFMLANSPYAQSVAAYNRNKLLRTLMEDY